MRLSSEDPPGPPPAGPPPTDVLVVGDRAFGAPTEEVGAGAIALAREAATPVLGLGLAPGLRPRVASVTPHPDLSVGGDSAARALERLLAA